MKGKGMSLWISVLGLLWAVLFSFKISSGHFRAQTWSYISNSRTAVGHQGRPWPALDTLGWDPREEAGPWRRTEHVMSRKGGDGPWQRLERHPDGGDEGRGRGWGSLKDFPRARGAQGGWGGSLLTYVQSHCRPCVFGGQPPDPAALPREIGSAQR